MAVFDSERYFESVKEVFNEYLKSLLPNTKITFNYPDVANDEIDLTHPVLWLEINNSKNVDKSIGYTNGHGGRTRRKRIKISLNVISTGDGNGILERDRIIQKLEMDLGKPSTIYDFASRGLRRIDARFMNSYRARENVHISRIEIFAFVTIRNEG